MDATTIVAILYAAGWFYTYGHFRATAPILEHMITVPAWRLLLVDVLIATFWPVIWSIFLWAMWSRREY